MLDVGIVTGSKEQAIPLVVGKDTVYQHNNIEKVDTDGGSDMYRYREIQYGKDEYIRIMSEKNDSLETEATNLQLALADVYEQILAQ